MISPVIVALLYKPNVGSFQDGCGSCFARVSSHPALAYSMPPDQAFSVLRRFLAGGRHRFVYHDLSCADRVLRTDLMTGANQVMDHSMKQ